MRHDTYDMVILGCGPAGMSAAINATIRNKKVIVIGGNPCSPPMHRAQKIDNYLGIPSIAGAQLLDHFMEHCRQMDIEFLYDKAELVSDTGNGYQILVGDHMIQCTAIILATGVPYRSTLPREEELLGKGLGYCATCDGPLYRNKDVMIVSHNAEGEAEANFMAEICQKVYYIPLYKEPGAMDGRVQVLAGKPVEIMGADQVEGVKMKDGQLVAVDGLFVLGGETAPDRLIPGLAIEAGHIQVNRQQMTNLPGVYAAGDCTGKPYQVAKSVGEGQVAGLEASRYASPNKQPG